MSCARHRGADAVDVRHASCRAAQHAARRSARRTRRSWTSPRRHRRRSRRVRHAIDVAFRVGLAKADRRRQHAVAQRQRASPPAPARRRRSGNGRSSTWSTTPAAGQMRAEHLAQRRHLGPVVQPRAGAVRVDVIRPSIGAQAGIVQRRPHRLRRARRHPARSGRRHRRSCRSPTTSARMSAPRAPRPLPLLQHQDRRRPRRSPARRGRARTGGRRPGSAPAAPPTPS